MNNKIVKGALPFVLVLIVVAVAVCVIGIGKDQGAFVPCVLPAETEKEIEDAWYRENYEWIDLSDPFYRYYGAYEDCHVFFESGPQADPERKTVAGKSFSYQYPFEIRVYKAGVFATLENAYQDGWLTGKQISSIADHHKKAEQYYAGQNRGTENVIPDSVPGTIPDSLAALRQEFETAWREENRHDFNWENYKATRYYGTYGDCVVGFNASVLQAEETKEIAGETFSHNVYFTLFVFYDGEFTNLEQAFKHGLVSQEQVAMIAEYHRKAEDYVQKQQED